MRQSASFALPAAVSLIVGALAAGCYQPEISDGQYACDVSSECPAHFHCSCGLCIAQSRPVEPSCDRSLMTGCTNGGQRDSSDPKVPDIAFCPAAFRLPGVGAQSSCDRKPGTDGYAADGSRRLCSALDNCAPGWHLCLDGDLRLQQLDRVACAGGDGFFLSGQSGTFSIMAMQGRCAPTGASSIFGCGGQGDSAGCDVLGRSMRGPCVGGFDCTWPNPGNTVIRPSASGKGGVLCCR